MSEPDVMICQHNKRLSECEFCVPMIEDAARRALQPLGDFTVLAATASEPSEAPKWFQLSCVLPAGHVGDCVPPDGRIMGYVQWFTEDTWQVIAPDAATEHERSTLAPVFLARAPLTVSEEVREALSDLVAKLETIMAHPSYISVFTIAHAHGVPYHGPTFEAELNHARSCAGGGPL